MQVNSVFHTTTATPINKGGNNLQPSRTEKTVEPQKTSSLFLVRLLINSRSEKFPDLFLQPQRPRSRACRVHYFDTH